MSKLQNLKKYKYALMVVAIFAILVFVPKEPQETVAAGSAAGPTPTPTPTPITVEVYAEYTGGEVVVGTEYNTAKLIVTAVYKDGREERVYDYRVSDTTVKKLGENKIGVYYHGRATEFYIYGREELVITDLVADYVGGDVIVSNEIDKRDIIVTAYYNWSEKDPLEISYSAFSITPSRISKPGVNTVKVTYGSVSTFIEVYGVEKEVVDAECRYIGKEAVVGSTLTTADFQLKVKYNDDTTGAIDKFSIVNPKVMGEGENIITIVWRDWVFDVPVNGVPKSILADAFNDLGDLGDVSTAIILVVSNADYGQSVKCLPVEQNAIKEAIDRVVVTNKYIGYELTYDDPEAYKEFPILTRVIRPEDYDPDKFAVYYTPNRKTIMAKVNGEYLDEERTQYAYYMYEPGTYAMLEEISSKLVTSINIEKQYITMKVDRNYSLNPIIRPLSAANKDLTYWSSDEFVCSVSESGKLYSEGPGECEIWIEANDGSGVYTVVYVTVKEK